MPVRKTQKKSSKGIYRGMKPEHRIRHRIGLLEGVDIKNPLHRGIIKFTKDMLMNEEKHGNGFWSKAWSGIKDGLALPAQLINQVPFLKEGLDFAFPELAPVFEIIPKVQQRIYGNDTNQWLTDFLGDASSDTYYKGSNQPEEEEEEPTQQAPVSRVQPDIASKELLNNQYTEKLDNVVESISNTNEPPVATTYDNKGRVIGLDDALKFPLIYNYDENNKPQYLQDFLIQNGVAGRNFSRNEFGNTYESQEPYAFLNHPLNGGNIRKIDFKRNCC